MNNDWVRLLSLENERKVHWVKEVLDGSKVQYQFLPQGSSWPSTSKIYTVYVPQDTVISTLSILEKHGFSINKLPFATPSIKH